MPVASFSTEGVGSGAATPGGGLGSDRPAAFGRGAPVLSPRRACWVVLATLPFVAGCGEVCLRGGAPVNLKLWAIELDRPGEDPVLRAAPAGAEDEVAKMFEQLGLDTPPPPGSGEGNQVIVFQTAVSEHGYMEWITSAELEAESGDLVLRIRSDWPCSELVGTDTGGGFEYIATIWTVASLAPLAECRYGERCHQGPSEH